jgi:ABC-type bacteriocin/lantibiotic exporter with double-glycine peptidase domain
MNHADTMALEAPTALLDCLLRGLGLLSRRFDRPLSPADIRAAGPVPAQLGAIESFQRIAEKLGYRIAVSSLNEDTLDQLPTPFFILPHREQAPLLITERRGNVLFAHDLASGEARILNRDFLRQSPLTVLLVRPVTETAQARDWRQRVIDRLKGVFWELAGASLFINLFALATPIVMMAIYNRVLSQSALTTLNEIVHNAVTVKSLGLESELEQRWNRQLGLAAWAGFRSTHLASSLGVLSMSVQSFTALATVYVGARLIIAGELSFGALIAANLLASRALAPIRQIVAAWHQVQ